MSSIYEWKRDIRADGANYSRFFRHIVFKAADPKKAKENKNLIASLGARRINKPLCEEIEKCAQENGKQDEADRARDSNVQLVILIHVLLSWLSKEPAIKSHKEREIDINK